MTADTTSSEKRQMDCDRVTRDEVLQGYLLDTLTEEDREAFERHYFDCERCFDDLRSLETLRDGLRQSPEPQLAARRGFSRWLSLAAAGAVVMMAVATILWTRVSPSTDLVVTMPPDQTAPQFPGPQTTPAPASTPSLEQLARVEPAPYEPATFRSVPDAATARFQQGMGRYRQADYRAAIADLQAAASLDPDAPHVRFFLGVSQLLAGDLNAGVESLRATIALGDSPYLEEAHLYLAKAFLQRRDVGAAETQLNNAIALGGSHREEARRLLEQLGGVKAP